ncbi:MAG: hypothetical protein AB1488_05285 [Nitrospirota bacterium]
MKKLFKSKWILIFIAVAFVLTGYFVFTTVDSKTPVASAAKKTYSGTLYVAGMGGHFTKADVTIDPNDTENPIKVKDLGRVVIGNKKTHPTHDPRIDVNDRTKMYWSTYLLDPDGNLHVGISDLKTGDKIKDVAVKLDPRAKWTGANYCGSGQSKTLFMPVTMTDEAYIDVFDKKTLEHKHRVFLDYKLGETKFYHGTNTPDMKKFLVVVNLATGGKPNGKIDLIMLDLPALEKGKAKVLAKNTITGEPGKTLTFRQYFTDDGKLLLQSGRDRFYLIDAKTLKPIDEEMVKGENHDAMPTPDGKYAVLTLRQTIKDKEGKDITDGTIQLYDMEAKKQVGKPVSTCNACHEKIGIKGSAVLCGIDGNWK